MLTVTLLVFSLAPLSKVRFGAIRGLAFPRQQFFMAACMLAIFVLPLFSGSLAVAALAFTGLIAAIQLGYLVKFTPLWRPQSVRAKDSENGTHFLSLMAANVKKSNRSYDQLTGLIQEIQPEIVIAIEVDDAWIVALKSAVSPDYAHWIDVPMDNGYGICVLSKLVLKQSEVRELITQDVPSVRTVVTLPDGRDFRLYVVHPEPPIINHDTKGRDSEIAQVGIEAAQDPLPVIVSGDLNDVAWSTVTRQFQRLSGLLDPRVGRGFFNTFNAFYFFARWPLDHLFHDPQFRFVKMERCRKINSDHFPMYFELALARSAEVGSDTGTSSTDELQEIKTIIRDEKERPRGPIGADWENED